MSGRSDCHHQRNAFEAGRSSILDPCDATAGSVLDFGGFAPVRKSNFALRLQPSLLEELRGVAKAEDTTLNQFINVAVAEKLVAIRTEAYFRERAARADIPGALEVLDRLGIGNAPLPGDKMPEPPQNKRRAKKRQANK
jgi:predicted HicB family RNase H-like nuclease